MGGIQGVCNNSFFYTIDMHELLNPNLIVCMSPCKLFCDAFSENI